MLRTILASPWQLQDANLYGRIVIREQTEKPTTNYNRFMTHMESRTSEIQENFDVPITHPERFTVNYSASSHTMGVYDLRLDEAYTDYLRRYAQEGMR